MRLLDLFCGRWGWSRAFAARGWECWGLDLVTPPEIPQGCHFEQLDIMDADANVNSPMWIGDFMPAMPDFVVCSSPCQQFSVHGMPHFFKHPPYPELGIVLFRHAKELCESFGVPYVMENVRAAQQFVGPAVHHCGPFYLWGNAVPPLLGQGIKKGLDMGRDPITGKRTLHLGRRSSYGSKARAADKAVTATIPPELANAVADYAERLCEARAKTNVVVNLEVNTKR